MALPFGTWTLDDATEAVGEAVEARIDPADMDVNRAFIEEQDHFQSGTRWMGPWGETDAAKALILQKVEPKFVPVDALNEVLGRHVAALLKTEADVQLALRTPAPPLPSMASDDEKTAREAEDARVAEATAPIRDALAAWWDRVRLWEQTRLATARSRWAGRGLLRLWLPRGRLETVTGQNDAGDAVAVEGMPTKQTLADALQRLELMAPEPDEAAVVTDPDTQATAAVFLYTVEDGSGNEQQFAEVWFAEPNADGTPGDTVLRVLGPETEETFRFPVGGHLPIAEMLAPLLITDPIRRLQDQLNFFQSLLGRAAETAGFPERYISGAGPEGYWSSVNPGEGQYAETRDQGGVTYYLIPTTRTLGAGTTVELRGIQYDTDGQGGKGVTTPTVTRFDPVDPDYVLKSIDAAYATLLRQCKQGHMVGSSSADQSGEGQQQRRADFEDDCNAVKPGVEGLLRAILESALAFAGAMTAEGQAVLDLYRVVVTLHVDSGPISPDEIRVIREQVEAGLLSEETALARMGVEDVGAELERIRNSPISRARLSKVQAEAVVVWTQAGCSLRSAGKRAGLTEEEQGELEEGVQPANPTERVPGVVGVIGQ